MSALLETERLTLRAPVENDLPALVALLNDYDVTKNLTSVPFPFSLAPAREWLAKTNIKRATGKGCAWAVYRGSTFVGICSVMGRQASFDLGYWYGKRHWGMGYATEAGQRAVRFAFEELGLAHVSSGYYCDNPASGHVLEKLGFEPAGTEMLYCLSRAANVICNRVWLEREDFVQKKAA